MSNSEFGGDKKLPVRTLLAKYERRFIDLSDVEKAVEYYRNIILKFLA